MARSTAKRAGIGCVVVLFVSVIAAIAVPLLTRRDDWDWRTVPLKDSKPLASVSVDNQTFVLRRLLETAWNQGGDPKADNETFDNVSLDNRATWIFVDQDDDGDLDPIEGRPANLPQRIKDSMFDLAPNEEEGVGVKPSKEPLQGIVLGRVCPSFDYADLDGKRVSRTSVAGRVTVLQIWSATCEPTVRRLSDMARWRRQYGDKLNLVSISVDRSYGTDAAARESIDKAVQKAGASWPIVLEPQGWNGLARRFNLYHYGFQVLSADNKVRAANLSAREIDDILKAQFP